MSRAISSFSGKAMFVASAVVMACVAAPAMAQAPGGFEMCGDGTTFDVELKGVSGGSGTLDTGSLFQYFNLPDKPKDDTITLPKGCGIYAFLISGYSGNKNLDQLIFSNVAEFVARNNGYVHVSWWNNLLKPYMVDPVHDQPISYLPAIGALQTVDHPAPVIGSLLTPIPQDALRNGPIAYPDQDIQFQADASAVIQKIKAVNPDALVVVVGHSMGGGAAARLGRNLSNRIDLLALVDPVNNRDLPQGTALTINYNWTRWRANHDFKGYKQYDCTRDPLGTFCKNFGSLFFPSYECAPSGPFLVRRPLLASKAPLACPKLFPYVDPGTQVGFGSNVKNLYHRWQHEAQPPIDFLRNEPFKFWADPGPAGVLWPNYQAEIPTDGGFKGSTPA